MKPIALLREAWAGESQEHVTILMAIEYLMILNSEIVQYQAVRTPVVIPMTSIPTTIESMTATKHTEH